VHWPSTAKHDELMVRQDELPWQGRATVLVDVRRTTHTPESLELVVSAAASVVNASWRRRDLVRLVSTDGADSGFAAGYAHVESIMEHLAVVQATPGGTLRGVVDALGRGMGGGGALVVIVANLATAELQAVARMRGGYGSLTIVQFDASAWDSGAAPASPSGSVALLRVTSAAPFADVWNQAMRVRTRSGHVPVATTVEAIR
jgi:uncharacterized protein (DUF58 family)